MVYRAAVLGSPIEHSLSPVLHRAAYAALGLDEWEYTRQELNSGELQKYLENRDGSWRGFSVTMPLKREALACAETASTQACDIGAANTLLITADGVHAENTDILGVRDALHSAGVSSLHSPLVLGAGGTAQAVLAALARMKPESVTLAVREPARARDALACAARVGVNVECVQLSDAPPLHRHDAVISTLPAGAADFLSNTPFSSETVLFDVVYHPWPTPLAHAHRQRGGRVLSGYDLLLHQAAHQVALMTGHTAPLESMRDALNAEVRA